MPDLLPARMVNEFVYCPRLFFLEWVDALFADNDDTRVGRFVHRKVDDETGAAPLPDEGELRVARSLTLSSTQALHECFARDIPVLWLSAGGWLHGHAIGQPPKHVELRRHQTSVHALWRLAPAWPSG